MKHTIEKNIVIIGAGRLGVSLAMGFLNIGVNPDLINLIQRNKEEINIDLKCSVFESLEEADLGDNIEAVIIAVKPKDMDGILPTIDRNIRLGVPIVSLAAQIKVGDLMVRLSNRSGVFRVKPSVLVRQGDGCILIHKQDDDPLYEKVRSIFSRLGRIFEVTENELEIYSWYGIHLPCVFLPKLIQSMLAGKTAAEKQKVFSITVSGLEGLLRYLKTSENSGLELEGFLDDLPDLTMSPHGLNEKAYSYLNRKNALAIINEARDVYVQAGLGKS